MQGTASDIEPRVATYPTFADLYRYCYLVASVVGLVVFEFSGISIRAAEKLAEETGIAFQLTNILRDVGEDALRGRLYLPLKEWYASVCPPDHGRNLHGRQLTAHQRRVLDIQAERAGQFYKSAEAFLPLISPDSRAALWVLVTVYSVVRHIEQAILMYFPRR